MTTPLTPIPAHFQCSYECGNYADMIVTTLADSSTLQLCVPCFVKTADDMVKAITEADDVTVQEAVKLAESADTVANPLDLIPGD